MFDFLNIPVKVEFQKEKVKESSEKVLMNFFTNLGGWPMITGEDNPNSPLELLKKIYHFGFTEFVNVGIMINPMEPDRHIIKVNRRAKKVILYLK